MTFRRCSFFFALFFFAGTLSFQARGQEDEPGVEPGATSNAEDEAERQPVVLLTGFGPFGSHRRNPSWIGAKGVHGKTIEGHKVVSVELPVDFREVWQRVPELIKEHDPEVVIHFGVFRNGPLRFERQARNSIGTIDDVVGYHPEDGRVVEDGPMIYESRLPENELINQMPEAGFDMIASEDAGRYVCEFTFYTEIYFQEKLGKESSAGFIHVAPLNRPLSARKLKKAMAKAVEIVLKKRAANKAAAEVAEINPSPSSRPAIGTEEPTTNPSDTANSNSDSETSGNTSSSGLTGALRGDSQPAPSTPNNPERRGPR